MQLEQIRQIAVIGLGRMGHGIAQSFAMGGFQVRGFDVGDAVRQTTLERIGGNLNDFVANDVLQPSRVEEILGRITIVDSEADAAEGAQFVVEAIAEDRTAKREFFERIENHVAAETILASNSSTFTISQSAEGLRNAGRAIVTHWFNPPHIVPTVEVVPGPQTTEQVTSTTIELHRRIGKLAVRINAEIPGFLVNRIQIAMIREVWDMYERGIASPEDIDAAVRGSIGFRLAACGPLGICDFGGLDIWATVYRGLAPELRRDTEVPASIRQLVEQGRCGTRTAGGIHDYDADEIDELTSQRDEAMLRLAKLLDSEGDR